MHAHGMNGAPFAMVYTLSTSSNTTSTEGHVIVQKTGLH
jgi:hypothetical protein